MALKRPQPDKGEVPENTPGRKIHGLPKKARLKLKREFDAVFQERSKGVTHGLVVYVKRNGKDLNRLGLVI